MSRHKIDNPLFFPQLLAITLSKWKWLSVKSNFESWADVIGSLLVAPAVLLPILTALLVLYQHRSNIPEALKPTHLWRKNALKQNKKDKYLGEKRIFRYKLNGTDLERERITDPVISALGQKDLCLGEKEDHRPCESQRPHSVISVS